MKGRIIFLLAGLVLAIMFGAIGYHITYTPGSTEVAVYAAEEFERYNPAPTDEARLSAWQEEREVYVREKVESRPEHQRTAKTVNAIVGVLIAVIITIGLMPRQSLPGY